MSGVAGTLSTVGKSSAADGDTAAPTRPRDKTIKALAALSGNRCAFPACQQRLWDPGLQAFVGEIAHIHGERPGAARYDPSLGPDAVHGIANLVLLCSVHHHVVDQNPQEYPPELLRRWKRAVEDGPSEAPDAVTMRTIEHLMLSGLSDVSASVDRLTDHSRKAAEALVLKDLPLIQLVSTGGRHLLRAFEAHWEVRQVGGNSVGQIFFRFVVPRSGWPNQTWQSRPLEGSQHKATVVGGPFDFTAEPRVVDDWLELQPDQLGLEVCFEYAGSWWRRRHRASIREGTIVGKAQVGQPMDLPTEQMLAHPLGLC